MATGDKETEGSVRKTDLVSLDDNSNKPPSVEPHRRNIIRIPSHYLRGAKQDRLPGSSAQSTQSQQHHESNIDSEQRKGYTSHTPQHPSSKHRTTQPPIDHQHNNSTPHRKASSQFHERIHSVTLPPSDPAEPSEPCSDDETSCYSESDSEASKSSRLSNRGDIDDRKRKDNRQEDEGSERDNDKRRSRTGTTQDKRAHRESYHREERRKHDESRNTANRGYAKHSSHDEKDNRSGEHSCGERTFSRESDKRPREAFSERQAVFPRITCRKKLWVGDLPSDCTSGELRGFFETYGKLSRRGNAFVKYTSAAQAIYAYRQCYVAFIRDRQIKVKFAVKKPSLPHNKLLYVNGVPMAKSRSDVRQEFEKFGEVEDVQMFSEPHHFALEECAVLARKALKSQYFIQFGKIRPSEDKPSSHDYRDDRTYGLEDVELPRRPLTPRDISECDVCDVLEPLSEETTSELTRLLNTLHPTNAAIRERRDWIFKHYRSFNDIMLHISVVLVSKDNPFLLRLSALYLIHDILSKLRRNCTEILDAVSALTLPHLQRVIGKFRSHTEKEKHAVLDVLSLWEKHNVFSFSVVSDLRNKFNIGEELGHDEF